jgi:replication factor C small subunit
LLVEKYRPQKLEDVVGFKPTFEIGEDMPHLLLHGGAGTGKTTTARAIIKMLNADSITLNASSERGIEIVRQKISDFASTQSTNKNIKIVFLDEADHLTSDAQTALRNTMETYSYSTRFIMTANYISRIIEPLQSRCILVKFDNIPKPVIIERLKYICDSEGIPYELDALNKIVDQTGSDMRSAINKIEELKSGVFISKLSNEINLAKSIFECVKKKDFNSSRQLYLDANPDNEQFLKDLYEVIFTSDKSLEYKKLVILEICKAYKGLKAGSWPQIIIESMLVKLC